MKIGPKKKKKRCNTINKLVTFHSQIVILKIHFPLVLFNLDNAGHRKMLSSTGIRTQDLRIATTAPFDCQNKYLSV